MKSPKKKPASAIAKSPSTEKPDGSPLRTPEPRTPPLPREWALLVMLSVALFLTRSYAAKVLGFGDSEALYASYALHPAPAYLDHPGLVGQVARAIGEGSSPSPAVTHAWTAVVAAIVPALVAATARIAGASMRASGAAGLVALATPMLAVGLFALTPDLLLAPLWLLVLALGVYAAKEGASTRADVAWLFVGVLAGVATWAKVSGFLLFFVIGAFHLRKGTRRPYAVWGMLAGLLVVAPLVKFEASHGFAMIRHRLGQSGGLPLAKGLGAITLGQVLYLSPLVAYLAFVGLRAAYRKRHDDDPGIRFVSLAVLVPAVGLAVVSLVSRQAEPHWLAPAWLGVPVLFALADAQGEELAPPRRISASIAVAGLFTVVVHAWVLSPRLLELVPKTAAYEPRYDLANELYGWPRALEGVREALGESDTVVVAPHWTLCAQLHAGLGPGTKVGCATPVRDDFDDWLPRDQWKKASRVLYVTDNRFESETSDKVFPGYASVAERRVTVYRAGRRIRTFTLSTLEYAAHASR